MSSFFYAPISFLLLSMCLFISSYIFLVLLLLSPRFFSFFLQVLSSSLLFLCSWCLLPLLTLFHSLLWIRILLLLNKLYYSLQTSQMLATQANSFTYNPQRTIGTVLASWFIINFTINCSSLSGIIFSSNLCNFYILSLNNLADYFANVPSVVAIKYTIFDNLLHTTSIVFFLTTNGNLVMKFTIVRYSSHWRWKSMRWAWKCADL